MKLTEIGARAENRIRGYVVDAAGWQLWKLDTGRRPGRTPTFLAVHRPTSTLIAVYVRTRRPLPHEWPDTSWLPEAAVPVVWHPARGAQIRAWLVNPSGPPPGARDDTTPETGVWMERFTSGQAPRTAIETRAVRAAKAQEWAPSPRARAPAREGAVHAQCTHTTIPSL